MSAPTKKQQRYDRQLRLWGDHGQDALEKARVLLFNANATGTELLKNLVLPGVGSFAIVDQARVTEADLGNNFFVTSDAVGKNRGQVATENLRELNEEVRGQFIDQAAEAVVSDNPNFVLSFSVVIASDLPEPVLLKLSQLLWNAGIPLVVVKSYGMIGYMRIAVPEHTVIESHPDDSIEDLRILSPFPELAAHCARIDVEGADDETHAHIPFAVLLFKAVEAWQKSHDGNVPSSYKEKKEIRSMLENEMRRTASAPDGEENFQEAMKFCNTALTDLGVPPNVRAVVDSEKASTTSDKTPNFWIMARALKDFIERHGCLPVRGSLPDMTAKPDAYVALQAVYREKADRDCQEIASCVSQLLTSVGRAPDSILHSEVKRFCKNAAFLSVQSYRSLEEELAPETCNKSELESLSEDPDNNVVWYVMLRAVERFKREHGRCPGDCDSHVDEDIPVLLACVTSFLSECNVEATIKEEYVQEMCRYGGSEPHTVASYIGGCAAQEVIKLVTRQFVPVNNTYIFNGVVCTTTTAEL